jgi:hypothetical protein
MLVTKVKEETHMSYNKPQIVPMESPIKAIQGGTKGCIQQEGAELVTAPAYEADE